MARNLCEECGESFSYKHIAKVHGLRFRDYFLKYHDYDPYKQECQICFKNKSRVQFTEEHFWEHLQRKHRYAELVKEKRKWGCNDEEADLRRDDKDFRVLYNDEIFLYKRGFGWSPYRQQIQESNVHRTEKMRGYWKRKGILKNSHAILKNSPLYWQTFFLILNGINTKRAIISCGINGATLSNNILPALFKPPSGEALIVRYTGVRKDGGCDVFRIRWVAIVRVFQGVLETERRIVKEYGGELWSKACKIYKSEKLSGEMKKLNGAWEESCEYSGSESDKAIIDRVMRLCYTFEKPKNAEEYMHLKRVAGQREIDEVENSGAFKKAHRRVVLAVRNNQAYISEAARLSDRREAYSSVLSKIRVTLERVKRKKTGGDEGIDFERLKCFLKGHLTSLSKSKNIDYNKVTLEDVMMNLAFCAGDVFSLEIEGGLKHLKKLLKKLSWTDQEVEVGVGFVRFLDKFFSYCELFVDCCYVNGLAVKLCEKCEIDTFKVNLPLYKASFSFLYKSLKVKKGNFINIDFERFKDRLYDLSPGV